MALFTHALFTTMSVWSWGLPAGSRTRSGSIQGCVVFPAYTLTTQGEREREHNSLSPGHCQGYFYMLCSGFGNKRSAAWPEPSSAVALPMHLCPGWQYLSFPCTSSSALWSCLCPSLLSHSWAVATPAAGGGIFHSITASALSKMCLWICRLSCCALLPALSLWFLLCSNTTQESFCFAALL